MNILTLANIDYSDTYLQIYLPSENRKGFFRIEFEDNSVLRTKYFCSLSAAYFYLRYIKHLDFSLIQFYDCLSEIYFSPNFSNVSLINISYKNFRFLLNYYKDSWNYYEMH